MWSKPQVAAFQRAIALCEKVDSAIAKLEQMAKHMPEIAERVAELRARRDNLHAVSTIAIGIDPHGEG